MCHALLQDRNFFRLLLRIDEELAAEARAAGCPCGGVLHCADYPRKPRACPNEFRAGFDSRFSFCCNRCRLRTTSMSVRFLGRRVYLGAVVVLVSAMRYGLSAKRAQFLAQSLSVPRRTLERWRAWWLDRFAQTSFWKAARARFVPPVVLGALPASLLERFRGEDIQARLIQGLCFLAPLSTLGGGI